MPDDTKYEPEQSPETTHEAQQTNKAWQTSVVDTSVHTDAPTKPPSIPMPSSPGVLVLQWLTYAFWGWMVLGLSWLTWLSISFFFNSSSRELSSSSAVAYSLAAVIVLFIIALTCDLIYSRKELTHKTGAATLIMIIHAVLFALFAIGWVIAAVFAVVSLIIGPDGGEHSGALTTLATGVIIGVVYGATLLRTLRPVRPKHLNVFYWMFMAAISVTIIALGIVGPALSVSRTKDDRLIETQLPSLALRINNYANDNQKLPSDLSVLTNSSSSEVKTLIQERLVTYKPGKEVTPSLQTSLLNMDRPDITSLNTAKIFEYTLCVSYKASKDIDFRDNLGDTRQTQPQTAYHAAGHVCYDLVTDYSYPKMENPALR